MLLLGAIFIVSSSILAIGFQSQKSSLLDTVTSFIVLLMPLVGGGLLVRSKTKTTVAIGYILSAIFICLIIYSQLIST